MHFLRTISRSISRLSAALLVAVATACSPDSAPTAAPPVPPPPPPAPQADLIGGLLGTTTSLLGGVVDGLIYCPTTTTYSSSKAIGPAGGTIRVGPHSLFIPPYALSEKVEISAVAPAGDYVAVEFQPHGLEFKKKAALTLSYEQCNLTGTLLYSLKPNIVYVDDSGSQLQILEVLSTVNNLFTQSATGRINHFSKYMLAD